MRANKSKKGTVAFVTTPMYRKNCPRHIKDFIYSHLYQICGPFHVKTTGRTGNFIVKTIEGKVNEDARRKIAESMEISWKTFEASDLRRWKETIKESLDPVRESFPGMIQITFELVENRLDAVIHFMDWEDMGTKPDSAVLLREANVHKVPIAIDPDTAVGHIRTWRSRLAARKRVFRKREPLPNPPLKGIEKHKRVLAIIAHDNMKLDTCRFAVEHARLIFNNYDYILSTGNTGARLREFMLAAGRSQDEVNRIRQCNSGPLGGDIQIAEAVVKGNCHKIVFLQDPTVSHPHDSDIRLFEQAVLHKRVHVELATNVESARLLIGADIE